MKKLWIISFIFVVMAFSLGNVSSKELNELAFVYGLGIDKAKDGYRVSMQVVNPHPLNTPTDKPSVFVYEDKARSIGKVIEIISKKTPREIILSQIRVILIDEQLAREEGLNDVLNYLLSKPGVSSMVDVLIMDNMKAFDALRVFSAIEEIPANEILKTLTNTEENWGSHQSVFPTQLKAEILSTGNEAIIPTLAISGKIKTAVTKKNIEQLAPKSHLHLSGLTILREDKKVGWINDKLSRVYYLIKGKLKSSYFTSPCSKNEEFGFSIIKAKTDIKGSVVDGTPSFNVQTKIIGDLDELNCNIDVSNPSNIKKLEKDMEKEVKKQMLALIEKSHKLQSDFIGFGDVLRISNKSEWKKIEKRWNQAYLESEFDIKVRVIIRNYGDTNLAS
ncbi:Ger(x)C family spore germination protein [Bacillus sp. JZ8]